MNAICAPAEYLMRCHLPAVMSWAAPCLTYLFSNEVKLPVHCVLAACKDGSERSTEMAAK